MTGGSASQQVCDLLPGLLLVSYWGVLLKRALTCVKETVFEAQKQLNLLLGDLFLSQDLRLMFLSRRVFPRWGPFWWSEINHGRQWGLWGPSLIPAFFGDWLALTRAWGFLPSAFTDSWHLTVFPGSSRNLNHQTLLWLSPHLKLYIQIPLKALLLKQVFSGRQKDLKKTRVPSTGAPQNKMVEHRFASENPSISNLRDLYVRTFLWFTLWIVHTCDLPVNTGYKHPHENWAMP